MHNAWSPSDIVWVILVLGLIVWGAFRITAWHEKICAEEFKKIQKKRFEEEVRQSQRQRSSAKVWFESNGWAPKYADYDQPMTSLTYGEEHWYWGSEKYPYYPNWFMTRIYENRREEERTMQQVTEIMEWEGGRCL